MARGVGNEAAHERSRAVRRPPAVESADVGLCLCCLQRVLEFHIRYRESPRDQAAR